MPSGQIVSPRKAARVAIMGGGPGGLFAARLIARAHPDWHVTVYERMPPTDTYGFGIGLTGGLMRTIDAVDPELRARLAPILFDDLDASFSFHLSHETAVVQGNGGGHVGTLPRAALLQVLTAGAREAGAEVSIGEAPPTDELMSACDLVVCAEGVGGATRAAFADQLGVHETQSRGQLIWCGADAALRSAHFTAAQTPHGTFVGHAYPYTSERATVVIEADDESIERAGCATEAFGAEGDSDATSLEYLSEAFTGLLGGALLLGNRSRWRRFLQLRCERWHHKNLVLIGDAVATAHPSLGSGTKLAMESAATLAEVIYNEGIGPDALATFDALRRPAVEALQERALRSQLWWESFPKRLGRLGADRLVVAYLSRAGAVPLDALARVAPAVAARAVADWADVDSADVPMHDLANWVLSRGAAHDLAGAASDLRVNCNDPWGPAADALVAEARARQAGGAAVLRIVGEPTRAAALDRLALAERLRLELGLRVAVAMEAGESDDAAAGLVAGRADAVTTVAR
jgi:anthraniloyl-CoA monooxygenase